MFNQGVWTWCFKINFKIFIHIKTWVQFYEIISCIVLHGDSVLFFFYLFTPNFYSPSNLTHHFLFHNPMLTEYILFNNFLSAHIIIHKCSYIQIYSLLHTHGCSVSKTTFRYAGFILFFSPNNTLVILI